MFEVTITRTFSAAHRLAEIGGTCEKLHGHNFTVEVSVASDRLAPDGLLIDFRELKGWTDEILDGLDHRCLNDIPDFSGRNPSSENIARHIHDRLKEKIGSRAVSLSKVSVWESSDAKVTYKE